MVVFAGKQIKLVWLWVRVADARAYFLQELAKLAAFGVPGAEVLFGRHHRADAASIGILSWAVHLPPLLGPDGLRAATQAWLKTSEKVMS